MEGVPRTVVIGVDLLSKSASSAERVVVKVG